METILMGTASAASGSGRDNTYLLLRVADDCTLIDVGGNPLGKLKTLNISTHHIKRVLLTHVHIDHIYGLPSLLWGMWLDHRTEPLVLCCHQCDLAWIEQWLAHLRMSSWPATIRGSTPAV